MTNVDAPGSAAPSVTFPTEREASSPACPLPATPTGPERLWATEFVIGSEKPYTRLFLISFFILFFELACIRWFGSTVVFLTFFTNIVLIACFLGMSVVCLAASRNTNYINWVLPLLAVGSLLSAGLLRLHQQYPRLLFIDVGNQRSPATIYFGTEYGNIDLARVVVPIEVIGGTFFILVALAFIGPGQEMGRAFDRIPNRVSAYITNVLGSLAGIVFFSALSYGWTNPLMWFTIAGALMIYFVPQWRGWQTLSLIAVLFVAGIVSYSGRVGTSVIWSPYYKITYHPKNRSIDTNNIAHQHMEDLRRDSWVYALTHSLNRDVGMTPYEDVMIIGAGSGNDVMAALMNGAKRLDAIEIDPAILQIGKNDHPNKPYDDKRLHYEETLPDGHKILHQSIIYEDGRQWLKRNIEGMRRNYPRHHQYDLVVYALVDSLVLHSSHSGSLRLESFLFTKEAFQDVKANVRPGGVFAMYNFYRQPWVIGRLNAMAKDVFSTEPLVFSMPTQELINADSKQGDHITFLFVGLPDEGSKTNARIEAMRSKLASSKSYWLATSDPVAKAIDGYASTQPIVPAIMNPADMASALTNRFFEFKPSKVDVPNIDPRPSDDWPQLYLKTNHISPEVQKSMIVIGVLSVLILATFMPKGRGMMPSGRMFFLGAGFMLLETKGVVHMSLLFGSTWITNSVVFFAILVMILLANLYVLAVKPQKLWPYYVLLIAALAVNALVPMHKFLELPGLSKLILSCAVIFVPVFFAGVIFGASFRDSVRPDVDLGWNIAGVILGALAENFSMMLGFNYLIFIAIGFYLLSMPFGRRQKLATALPAANRLL